MLQTKSQKEQAWWIFMTSLLHYNVPRFIRHIKDRGGVSKEEWQWLQCEDEDSNYPMHMILKADEYLMYTKNEETFKKALFVLVKTLAIMSFIPGGIRFMKLHFSVEIDRFVALDDQEKA